jgi:5,10-methylene-tetrahydrofolate dehydrogenase/methenyl tetrahydrofolate cyclohydrolase
MPPSRFVIRKQKTLRRSAVRPNLLLVAIGKAKFVTADMVREGAVVIDVGTNRLPDGKLVRRRRFRARSARRPGGSVRFPAESGR